MIRLKQTSIAAFLLCCIISPGFELTTSTNLGDTGEPEGCTTALVAGWAAPDGRPLLWKSRDVSNWHQEFNYYDLTPYSFIAMNYPDNMEEAYGGINEVGFSIENANALNFPDSSGVPDDDGIIMHHALQTCETVEDFLAYMDTTARIGRTRPSIYGVFDAYGGAGMLEASLYDNYWFDANDTTLAPDGVMVRANFAYMGGTPHIGQFRHDRSLELLEEAMSIGDISPYYILDIVARDLQTEDVDPYPLPFQGSIGEYPYGYVRDHNAVNREITQSCFVVQGVQPGENPLTCTMWIQCGEPTMTPMIPVWAAALSVPLEVDGDPDAPMCLRARQFFTYLYLPLPDPEDDIIDTWKLINDRGKGLLTYIRALEDGYYDFIESTVEEWRTNFPSSTVIGSLQDSLAADVFQGMMDYNPPLPVENPMIVTQGEDLYLSWPPVTQSVFGETITISGYAIYSNNDYFSNRMSGDSLGFTTNTYYELPAGTYPENAFLQVRAVMFDD